MIIIVCADNNNGMMFNNRRQSQDRTLRDHLSGWVLETTEDFVGYSHEKITEEIYTK